MKFGIPHRATSGALLCSSVKCQNDIIMRHLWLSCVYAVGSKLTYGALCVVGNLTIKKNYFFIVGENFNFD